MAIERPEHIKRQTVELLRGLLVAIEAGTVVIDSVATRTDPIAEFSSEMCDWGVVYVRICKPKTFELKS